jgi:hypothetical protein
MGELDCCLQEGKQVATASVTVHGDGSATDWHKQRMLQNSVRIAVLLSYNLSVLSGGGHN